MKRFLEGCYDSNNSNKSFILPGNLSEIKRSCLQEKLLSNSGVKILNGPSQESRRINGIRDAHGHLQKFKV